MDENHNKTIIVKKLMLILHEKNQFQNVAIQFSDLQTHLERVNFMYQLIKKYKLFPQFEHFPKSNITSTLFRLQGNAKYDLGDNFVAFQLYTRSIQFAENNSTELIKAIANRSAVLIQEKMPRECLVDIERALENHPPAAIINKLQKRKDRATYLLSKQTVTFDPFWYSGEAPIMPDTMKNPSIECASNSVKIESNRWHGKHVVATKKIKIGELIAVEDCYMKLVSSQKTALYCDYCCMLCYTLMPCLNCVAALYCSEDCRQQAFQQYHKYECKIIPNIIKNMDREDVFPLRTVLKAIMSGYRPEEETTENCYKSGKFNELRKLETSLEKRNVTNVMACAMKSALFYYLLNSFTNFFQVYNERNLFKELVLEMFLVNSCNGIDILEYIDDECKSPAHGLYSFASLFNHSCIANTFFCFHGSKVAVYAMRTIEKGQECLVNYVQVPFYMSCNEDRQMFLSRKYMFDCDCKACIEQFHFTFNRENISQWNQLAFESVCFLDRLSKARNRVNARLILTEMTEKLKRLENNELKGEMLDVVTAMLALGFLRLGNCRKLFGKH